MLSQADLLPDTYETGFLRAVEVKAIFAGVMEVMEATPVASRDTAMRATLEASGLLQPFHTSLDSAAATYILTLCNVLDRDSRRGAHWKLRFF